MGSCINLAPTSESATPDGTTAEAAGADEGAGVAVGEGAGEVAMPAAWVSLATASETVPRPPVVAGLVHWGAPVGAGAGTADISTFGAGAAAGGTEASTPGIGFGAGAYDGSTF